MVRKIVLGGAATAGGVACVFLIVVMVRQGVDRSGVWAGPLAALAGIVAAVAAVWGPVPWSAKVPVPPELEVPDWVVGRPVEVAAVVQALTDGQAGTVGITTGLYGAGGFGKTMLARMVCADRRVQRWFGRRVYLVTVGRDVRGSAAVAAKVNDVIKLVAGEDATFTDPQLAGMRLGALLDAGPRRLLVLDDVWEAEQLAPFAGGGKRCTRLVTTRVPELLAGRGTAVRVDQMSPEQARALLTAGLPTLDEAVTQGLLTATGRWPLLLRLVNTILADYERAAADMPAQAAKLLKRLREVGPAVVDDLRGSPVRGLDVDKPQERAQAVRATIAASTSLLGPDDAERFAELGVFAEDEIIPLRLAARLWQATAGLDDLAASQTYGRLAQLALVTYAAGPARGVTVHDVIRDFLRAELGPQRLADLNGTLLDAVGKGLPAASPRDPALPASGVAWWELGQEDRYLLDHLMEHMRDAGRADVAEAVACDLRWVGARLERFGPAAPAADLIAVGTPRSARMRAELARAAHLLAPTEPVGAVTDILHSRVADDPDWGPQVQALRDNYRHPRLVNRFLPPDRPHPALRRAIHAGHLWGSEPMAPVAGSTWLVTTGQPGWVRIWDATTGNVRWSVDPGYHAYSTAVAVDGTWMAITGGGPLIEIRDPATGDLICAVDTGHPHGVEQMAVAPDATWVATASPRLMRDQVLRIWDLGTGDLRRAVDTGHRRGVCQVVVAPDGTWLATLDETSDNVGQQDLRIWDAVTGTLLSTIGTGHAWGMVVAPDGTWLAVSDTQSPAATGRGTTVLIWDTPTGRLRHVIDTGHRYSIARLAVAPDGTWLATADFNWSANAEGGPCVQTWDTATGHRRWAIETAHPYGVGQVVVAPDSAWLATIGRNSSSLGGDPVLRIWDADTGAAQSSIDTGHRRGMEQVVVSPDGTWLATVDDVIGHLHYEQVIRIWDAAPHPSRHEVDTGHPHGIGHVAAGPDGTWLATIDYTGLHQDSRDPVVRIWDAATGTLRLAIDTGNPHGIRHVAVAPDGTWLATVGSGEPAPVTSDPVVRIWDAATGTLRLAIDTGNPHGIRHVAVAPDGTWLATTGRRDASEWSKSWKWDPATGVYEPFGVAGDPLVRIWDTATGRRRLIIDTGDPRGVRRITLAHDGTWLATTGRSDLVWPIDRTDRHDPVMRIWDCTTGTLRHAIDTGHVRGVDHVAVGPADAWLATTGLGDDPTVRIWDAVTGALRHVMDTHHPEGVNWVVAGPVGAWLATTGVGTDPVLRIWDASTGQQRHALRTDDPRGIRHLTVVANGSWLVTAGLGSFQLWTPDGECLATMRVDSEINHCIALPDASGVALAGSNGLYVFDLR